jgi:hypothetical protein
MDMQSFLTDFLAYLYENNIDIRDEKINWQVITKDFLEKYKDDIPQIGELGELV